LHFEFYYAIKVIDGSYYFYSMHLKPFKVMGALK
jgi:hypothetical protein